LEANVVPCPLDETERNSKQGELVMRGYAYHSNT
jgi:hypothetical protein